MKTIAILTTLGMLATPAFAGKSHSTSTKKPLLAAVKKAPDETLKFNFGESYGLKTRTSAEPESNDPALAAKTVTDSQVGKVVHDRVEELEYCWLRLPASKRTASSAVLHLAIEAAGTVAGVTIEGELPATVEKCITAAASKWTFPSADSGCEIEHGIAMGTKSDTFR